MLAVVTSNSGEALFEIGTEKELVHHLWDNGPQEAVARLIALLVDLQEHVEMARQTLPQW